MIKTTTLGAVLAGGQSRRFGSAKALAPFMGEAMALRAVRALEEICREVVVVTAVPVVARTLKKGPPPLRILEDRVPGAGPLAGLHAALMAAREEGDGAVLLLGCDMPLVTSELMAVVEEEGRSCDRPAAVPAPSADSLEPLCGWYSLDCLPVVERRLNGNDRSMMSLVEELGTHPIPRSKLAGVAHPELALRSVNTQGELGRLEGFLLDR